MKDLCERHEKGVLHKHQRALHKYSMMKKQMMSATVQNKEPESVEQLESRIVEVGRVWSRMGGTWAGWKPLFGGAITWLGDAFRMGAMLKSSPVDLGPIPVKTALQRKGFACY